MHDHSKEVSSYLKAVRRAFFDAKCPKRFYRSFYEDLKKNACAFAEEISCSKSVTLMLEQRFGTPEEIAASFDCPRSAPPFLKQNALLAALSVASAVSNVVLGMSLVIACYLLCLAAEGSGYMVHTLTIFAPFIQL